MRWQEAAPGLERAQCVMRPFTNPTTRDYETDGHNDYLRVYHRTNGRLVASGMPHYYGIERASGDTLFEFTPNDNRPYSRIISAERVESAVETATFLDICRAEGLMASYFPDGHWVVTPYQPDGPAADAQTLRGAYIAYHKAAKEAS